MGDFKEWERHTSRSGLTPGLVPRWDVVSYRLEMMLDGAVKAEVGTETQLVMI